MAFYNKLTVEHFDGRIVLVFLSPQPFSEDSEMRTALFTAVCVVLCLVATIGRAQEKTLVVLAKEFSSPFKDVTWKPQPGVYKFGSRVLAIKDEKGEVVSHVKHLGEDFLIEAGTPVLAVADGRISYSEDVPGTKQRPQWGGIIVITHWINEKVPVYTIYGHLERDEKIRLGDSVKRGQQIGRVAESNTAQNGWWNVDPHLHLQILLDPLGRYEQGKCPPGNDHIRRDGKLVPFPAPHRMLDHIAPSEVINAKNPVDLLLKEKADLKRRE